MSAATVALLNGAIRKAVAMPEVSERLASGGAEPRSSTPEELAQLMDATHRKFGDIIRAAGIQPE
jgi:tripartite-type tricarboxylate transporter receptor subunit TctC